MRLSAAQRQAIRQINDEGCSEGVPSRTLAVLKRHSFVNDRGELTMYGVNTYHRIMESGDGPEDLKELLRFR